MDSSINGSEPEKEKQRQMPSKVKEGCDPLSAAISSDDKMEKEDGELTPEEEENLKEINEYDRMINECKEGRENYKELYFIDKQWIKNWKKVTGYKSRKLFGGKYVKREGTIPPIDNSVVYVKRELYLREKEEKGEVIDANSFNNLKIISKELWDFFTKKYGGGPELKVEVTPELKNGTDTIDLFFVKLNFVILPKKEDIVKEDIIENLKQHTTFIRINKTVKEISEHIQNVIFDNGLLSKEQMHTELEKQSTQAPPAIEQKDVEMKEEETKEETAKEEETKENKELPLRIWTLNSITNVKQLSRSLIRKKEEIEEEKGLLIIDDIFDIIDLKNYQSEKIHKMMTQSREQTEYFFIVEQPPYIFKEIDDSKRGKCEFCMQKKVLRVSCKCKEVFYCSQSCLQRDRPYHENRCKAQFELENEEVEESENSLKGLVGLTNLGNTCFMNTSLQCLSNCYELTKYFLSGKYINDINEENPIGTKGILAKAYGNLLKHLWYGTSSYFTPSQFKNALGTFQKMFTGYRQHDTQEFLNYLLDGLHEDLNRVLKKPFIDKEEEKGNDTIKSHNSWIDFLRRNQSVLVDLFYGQFKSTLKCPDQNCKNISIIFEPFLSLSLPLGSKLKPFEIQTSFIFYDIKIKPISLTYTFYKPTNVMALRNKVAKALNIHPLSFLISNIYSTDKIGKFISPDEEIKHQLFLNVKYFFFQVDPKMFYSPYNTIASEQDYDKANRDFSKIKEDLNANKETLIKINSEEYTNEEDINKEIDNENLGFDKAKTVRTIIKMANESSGKNIAFPRVAYLPLDMSVHDLYYFVFKYFIHVILSAIGISDEDKAKFYDAKTSEDATKKLYDDLFAELTKEQAINDELDISSLKIPFRLRLIKERVSYTFREISNYKLIPYDSEIKLKDLFDEYKKSTESTLRMDEEDFHIFIGWNSNFANSMEQLHNYSEPLKELDIDLRSLNSSEQEINIYDCFKKFVKEEILEEHNEWFCSKCKQHQRASKKIDIYKAPTILIIHLKRFSNNSKIDNVVRFPITDLDIREFVEEAKPDEEYKYDLFAIANHYGSMGFGHYVAFAKNHFTNRWHEFNDSSVSEKREDDLVSSSAYVLFYRKKGTENKDYSELYEKKFKDYVDAYIKEDTMEVDKDNNQ